MSRFSTAFLEGACANGSTRVGWIQELKRLELAAQFHQYTHSFQRISWQEVIGDCLPAILLFSWIPCFTFAWIGEQDRDGAGCEAHARDVAFPARKHAGRHRPQGPGGCADLHALLHDRGQDGYRRGSRRSPHGGDKSCPEQVSHEQGAKNATRRFVVVVVLLYDILILMICHVGWFCCPQGTN